MDAEQRISGEAEDGGYLVAAVSDGGITFFVLFLVRFPGDVFLALQA